MNRWSFQRWLVAEIGRAQREYREDKRLYQLDVSVLPYFVGRVDALEKVLRVLTGKEKSLR